MGTQGADLLLSRAAYETFPYSIECKNQEKFKGIYDIVQQAIDQDDGYEPLVILKMNHKKPLVVLDAEHFFDLVLQNPGQNEELS